MVNGYGKAYSQAYQRSAVSTMDQRKMIVMMYEGAIKFLSIAADKQRKKDYYAAHTNILRGKSIIAELMASLNLESGGDIAANLQRLYFYMFNELIDANLEKSPERIEAVVELLRDLRSGWQSLSKPETPVEGPAPGAGRSKSINVRG